MKQEMCEKVKVLVTQLCPSHCDPMDCSPPGSSVHGILQVRMLEWVAISFSRGSSSPRIHTGASCLAGCSVLLVLRYSCLCYSEAAMGVIVETVRMDDIPKERMIGGEKEKSLP